MFPLAGNAAVKSMLLKIGNRTIVGEIRERGEAKHVYSEARTTGKKAGLTKQERLNLFIQSAANIAPGEKIVVEIRYLHAADYHTVAQRQWPGRCHAPGAGRCAYSIAARPNKQA